MVRFLETALSKLARLIASVSSTMVDRSPHHPKAEGSRPASPVATGVGKRRKKRNPVGENFQGPVFSHHRTLPGLPRDGGSLEKHGQQLVHQGPML
jgi:hypothetical protein